MSLMIIVFTTKEKKKKEEECISNSYLPQLFKWIQISMESIGMPGLFVHIYGETEYTSKLFKSTKYANMDHLRVFYTLCFDH